MAKINAIGNATQDLTIDPGASGDSFVQFDINGTGEFRIGVDDTDDSFRISQGSALGTNDTFIMTAAGERTMPLQSAFLAYNTTGDSNITGDGTAFIVGSGNALTEVFDQNNDFNTNGTFTAPVTGKYRLCASVQLSGIVAGHDGEFRIVTSNGTYLIGKNDCDVVGTSMQYTGSVFLDMDASDTATSQIDVSGGAKVVDLASGTLAGGQPTSFSGHLVA